MPIIKTMIKRPTVSTTIIDIETAFGMVHSSWNITCMNIAKHADNVPVNQLIIFESISNGTIHALTINA